MQNKPISQHYGQGLLNIIDNFVTS